MCKAKDEAKPKLDHLIAAMDRLAAALLRVDHRLSTSPRPPIAPAEEMLPDAMCLSTR